MWFLILYSKVSHQELDLDLRKNIREEHLARLKILQNEQRLLLGGPFPAVDSEDPEMWVKNGGFTGGMVIVKFDSLQEAEQWANKDPYVTSGFFAGPVTVKPWYQTVGVGVEFGRGS